MTYVVEDHYLAGIPQTALMGGLASRGISEHWSAGGAGREGARATARFFIDSASRNASYHELHWWDPATRTFGVLRIVRSMRAAHSLNPNPPTYAPTAEVRRILGDKVGDPNAACYAVAFAGMPADLAAALRDPEFVAGATRRRRELLAQETTITVERPLFNHGWAQPTTRTDAGDDLIGAIYAGLYPEDSMNDIKPVAPLAVVYRKGASYRLTDTLDDTGRVVLDYDSPRTVIGVSKGVDFGAGPDWDWILSETGRLKAVHSQDRISAVKLVPAGTGDVTSDQLAQAKRLEFNRGRDEGIAAYTAAGTTAAKAVTP